MTTALERLSAAFYNSLPYDPVTNPGGLAGGGHVLNLPALIADVGEVAGLAQAAAGSALSGTPSIPRVTNFASDGSIVETIEGGLTVTTTFNADGTIDRTFGPPVSTTIRTSFSGSVITETEL